MSSKKDVDLQSSDIILLGNQKYIVYSLKKDIIELLPITLLLDGENPDIIPKIIIPYASLEKYSKIDKYELFCLINQNSPLIKEVVENYLKNETQRSWKDKKH